MDPAAPVETPDGIRPAPSLHRLRPLLRQVVQRKPLQCADELAVHDPGREWIEIPGDRGYPHLVEQRQTLRDFAVEDEEARFCHPPDGTRRRVALRAYGDRTPRPISSAGQVAGEHPLVGTNDRKPCVRRRLVLTLEEPLRSCQPAAHRCHEGGVEQQVHGDTHCRRCCRDVVAGLHRRRVSALPGLDGPVEMTGRVGGLAEKR